MRSLKNQGRREAMAARFRHSSHFESPTLPFFAFIGQRKAHGNERGSVRTASAACRACGGGQSFHRFRWHARSEEHTSELQSLMRTSYAVFCLKKKNNKLSKVSK